MADMPDPDLAVIDAAEQAVSVLHPLRRSILEQLGEADSASGLSRRLGLPRQKVNYHLRELERESLVRLVEERRRGNCVERLYRATASAYLIAPETLGRLAVDPERVRDRFSSTYLLALAARLIRELGQLRRGADQAGKRLATLSLETEVSFASAADRHAFTRELTEALAAVSAKYNRAGEAPGSRTFRFIVGGHPALATGSPAGDAG